MHLLPVPPDQRKTRVFTREEVRAFWFYALEVAIIAIGLTWVAPNRAGKILGALFAIALLPVAPIALYLFRRIRHTG